MTEEPKLRVVKDALDKPVKASRSSKRAAAADMADDMPYDISFPPGCPVEPLGINGDDVYFLDQARQLRMVKADKLGQTTIRSLFGDQQELKFIFWPRYSKADEKGRTSVQGWRPEQAADCLYAEARRRGLWDILDRVRGPGCWRDEDGNLVMHSGDAVYHNGSVLLPGQIGRHVYPSAPAKPKPSLDGDGVAAALELLDLLKCWNWRRPDVDPELLLGWIVSAIAGGALSWRPLVWITGDKATGKSTLHEVLKYVMGPGGLISATDASAAGLWQTVGHASLPVALDEIEAEADNRKALNIIKLARHAASGGQTLRGGSDHSSSSFTVRSCFLFSSILIPPMLGQDVSRMGVLALDEIDKTSRSPRLEPKRLAEIGAAIRMKLMSDWPRLLSLIEFWKDRMADAGHGGRGGDQFGTLLACYDAMTTASNAALPDPDTVADWVSKLNKSTMAECEDDVSDTDRCISYMMSKLLDMYRSGERRTVGSWILQACGKLKHQTDTEEANRALGNIGLKVRKISNGTQAYYVLDVANDHQGLSELFRDSHWAGASGTNGVWVQALRRVHQSCAGQQRFNGLKKRCTTLPIDGLLEAEDE